MGPCAMPHPWGMQTRRRRVSPSQKFRERADAQTQRKSRPTRAGSKRAQTARHNAETRTQTRTSCTLGLGASCAVEGVVAVAPRRNNGRRKGNSGTCVFCAVGSLIEAFCCFSKFVFLELTFFQVVFCFCFFGSDLCHRETKGT